MPLATWPTRRLGRLWLRALAAAAPLLGAEWLRPAGQPRLVWLLPYPDGPRAAALLVRGAFAVAPLAAAALAVLAAAAAVTLAWGAARLARAG